MEEVIDVAPPSPFLDRGTTSLDNDNNATADTPSIIPSQQPPQQQQSSEKKTRRFYDKRTEQWIVEDADAERIFGEAQWHTHDRSRTRHPVLGTGYNYEGQPNGRAKQDIVEVLKRHIANPSARHRLPLYELLESISRNDDATHNEEDVFIGTIKSRIIHLARIIEMTGMQHDAREDAQIDIASIPLTVAALRIILEEERQSKALQARIVRRTNSLPHNAVVPGNKHGPIAYVMTRSYPQIVSIVSTLRMRFGRPSNVLAFNLGTSDVAFLYNFFGDPSADSEGRSTLGPLPEEVEDCMGRAPPKPSQRPDHGVRLCRNQDTGELEVRKVYRARYASDPADGRGYVRYGQRADEGGDRDPVTDSGIAAGNHYICCGLPLDHPGCLIDVYSSSTTKSKSYDVLKRFSPYAIIEANVGDEDALRLDMEAHWNASLQRGTAWLDAAYYAGLHSRIMNLKQGLAAEIASAYVHMARERRTWAFFSSLTAAALDRLVLLFRLEAMYNRYRCRGGITLPSTQAEWMRYFVVRLALDSPPKTTGIIVDLGEMGASSEGMSTLSIKNGNVFRPAPGTLPPVLGSSTFTSSSSSSSSTGGTRDNKEEEEEKARRARAEARRAEKDEEEEARRAQAAADEARKKKEEDDARVFAEEERERLRLEEEEARKRLEEAERKRLEEAERQRAEAEERRRAEAQAEVDELRRLAEERDKEAAATLSEAERLRLEEQEAQLRAEAQRKVEEELERERQQAELDAAARLQAERESEQRRLEAERKRREEEEEDERLRVEAERLRLEEIETQRLLDLQRQRAAAAPPKKTKPSVDLTVLDNISAVLKSVTDVSQPLPYWKESAVGDKVFQYEAFHNAALFPLAKLMTGDYGLKEQTEYQVEPAMFSEALLSAADTTSGKGAEYELLFEEQTIGAQTVSIAKNGGFVRDGGDGNRYIVLYWKGESPADSNPVPGGGGGGIVNNNNAVVHRKDTLLIPKTMGSKDTEWEAIKLAATVLGNFVTIVKRIKAPAKSAQFLAEKWLDDKKVKDTALDTAALLVGYDSPEKVFASEAKTRFTKAPIAGKEDDEWLESQRLNMINVRMDDSSDSELAFQPSLKQRVTEAITEKVGLTLATIEDKSFYCTFDGDRRVVSIDIDERVDRNLILPVLASYQEVLVRLGEGHLVREMGNRATAQQAASKMTPAVLATMGITDFDQIVPRAVQLEMGLVMITYVKNVERDAYVRTPSISGGLSASGSGGLRLYIGNRSIAEQIALLHNWGHLAMLLAALLKGDIAAVKGHAESLRSAYPALLETPITWNSSAIVNKLFPPISATITKDSAKVGLNAEAAAAWDQEWTEWE